MRIAPISDLHLEKRGSSALPRLDPERFDLLVCAGDIWEGEPEQGLAAVRALAAGRPAVIVPGNHERYRRGPDDLRTGTALLAALLREAERLNAEAGAAPLHVLAEGRSAVIAGVRFVGETLWSDFTLAGRWRRPDAPATPDEALAAAVAHVTSPEGGSREYFGAVLAEQGRFWSPADAMAAHERDFAALAAALAEPHAGPTVVVTHHPPVPDLVDAYRDAPGVPWWLPAFYASRALERLPEDHRPTLWISGHFHAAHNVRRGDTRLVGNPLAAKDHIPGLIVET
jgi:predicted MPP superfamily phosphohydrolase